jgi:hypothetical protein
MKNILFVQLLVAAFLACGCSSDKVDCADNDGDGYGEGADCKGTDCNDSDRTCHDGDCCVDCVDMDNDGFSAGTECEPGQELDCDDNDADRYPGKTEVCDGKDNDCDNDVPYTEADNDGDGSRICDDDCNDNDVNCQTGACCPDCVDADQDGYGVGNDCLGPDCNDDDPACNMGVCCQQQCIDDDGDGRGLGVDCLGSDCDDSDPNCWEGACCPAGGNCRAMISCVQNCSDQPCVDACYAQGDADAKALMDDIMDCIAGSGCTSNDWQCIGTACWQPMAACYSDNS